MTRTTEDRIDRNLEELERRKKKIDAAIRSLARQKAALNGIIVESPESLKCSKHPASSFDKKNLSLEWSDTDVYYCHECSRESPFYFYTRDNCAYRCPSCGIVVGWMIERRYDDIAFLSGSSGKEFACRLCGTVLGRFVEVVS
jgi:rubrerythrin